MVITRVLYGACINTTTNVCNVLIARPASIIACYFSIQLTAAAATDAWGGVQLSMANINSIITHDVQNTLATVFWAGTTASSTQRVTESVPTGALPVKPGDYIYAHCYRAGTAPTNATFQITVYLDER